MTDLMTAAILEEAALVVERGWCRYRLHDGDGRHCTLGAIIEVTARTNDAYVSARDALRVQGEADGYFRQTPGDISVFNDSQTDKRKIVRWMRRTARNLRANTLETTP